MPADMAKDEEAPEADEEEDEQWQSDMGIDGSAETDIEKAK